MTLKWLNMGHLQHIICAELRILTNNNMLLCKIINKNDIFYVAICLKKASQSFRWGIDSQHALHEFVKQKWLIVVCQQTKMSAWKGNSE